MRVLFFKVLQRKQWISHPYKSRYLGFTHLIDYLLSKQPEHEILYATRLGELKQMKPDLIAISSVTESYNDAMYTVEWVRKGGFTGPIILGGPHVTALPWTIPSKADCAVVGEGEVTFEQLVREYSKNRNPDLSQIPGLAYYRKIRGLPAQFTMTPPRTPVVLDTLPVDVTRDPKVLMDISTVRGCPFRCAHCVERPTQGEPRFLSAERMYALMKSRVEATGNPNFFFQDDTFLAGGTQRIRELHKLMSDDNTLGKYKIRSISLNANLVTRENLTLMKQIGCTNFGMGCESFNPRVLGDMKRGFVKLKHLDTTIKLCTEIKVRLGGSQVYGFPGETEAEMLDSIAIVKEYERTSVFQHWVIFVCTPLPGSELWFWARDQGVVADAMDWSRLRIDGNMQYFKSPWIYLNEEQIPKQRFIELLKKNGQMPNGHFI